MTSEEKNKREGKVRKENSKQGDLRLFKISGHERFSS